MWTAKWEKPCLGVLGGIRWFAHMPGLPGNGFSEFASHIRRAGMEKGEILPLIAVKEWSDYRRPSAVHAGVAIGRVRSIARPPHPVATSYEG